MTIQAQQAQQDKLDVNAQAFVRAFSDLIKDSTSHLATRDDIVGVRQQVDGVKQEVNGVKQAVVKLEKEVAKLRQDVDNMSDRLEQVEITQSEGYKRIYSWKDDMHTTFARKDELRPSAFKGVRH